jgi:hypothetical protein
MEERKYLPPKFSSVLQNLSGKINIVQHKIGETSIEPTKKSSLASEIRLKPIEPTE